MNKTTGIILTIIILLIVGGVVFLGNQTEMPVTETPPTENNQEDLDGDVFPNTTSNSELNYSLSYPSNFTELTVTEIDDLSALGYIPPCVENYDTCLFYSDTNFEGTNFDSAGLSIHTINDATAQTCEEFSGSHTLPDSTIATEQANDLTFYIAESGDAGAGHVAEETLYRTFHNNTCFEINTRVGYSQFGNYEAGSIEEFTEEDRANLSNLMKEMTHTFSFL